MPDGDSYPVSGHMEGGGRQPRLSTAPMEGKGASPSPPRGQGRGRRGHDPVPRGGEEALTQPCGGKGGMTWAQPNSLWKNAWPSPNGKSG